jgi:hypothetical protein
VLILPTSATVQLMSRVVLDFAIHVTLDPLGHDPVNWPDPNFGLTFLAEVKMAVTPLILYHACVGGGAAMVRNPEQLRSFGTCLDVI